VAGADWSTWAMQGAAVMAISGGLARIAAAMAFRNGMIFHARLAVQ
jgi:hypothetical protein